MVNYTLDSSSNIVPVSLTDERKGGCEADFSHLLFYKLNQKHWLVIDTFNDVVEIVDNKTKSDVFDCADTTNQYWNYYCIRCSKNKEKLEKLHADILQQAEKEKSVQRIIAIVGVFIAISNIIPCLTDARFLLKVWRKC